MAILIESMSLNSTMTSIDSMFAESRGKFFTTKTDMLFKVEEILNGVGVHMAMTDTDVENLERNQSGRVILKMFNANNEFINRQMTYFWNYNTLTSKYHIFGQIQ